MSPSPPLSKQAETEKPIPPPASKTTDPRDIPLRAGPPAAKSRAWLWIGVVLVLAIAIFCYFRSAPKSAVKAGAGDNGVRVVTAPATKGDIGVYLTGLGTVTPQYVDTVQSRVSGQLMKVLFTEGQTVKGGDLLAQIDSRPYEAQLRQYTAQQEHDQAQLDNANIDLTRDNALLQKNVIDEQDRTTQASLVKQDQGTVDSDQALIDATNLNIAYCNITAPISGRVGLRLVDPGNYIQATGTSGIVVIAQIQPITVVFTIPEDNVPDVTAQINAGHKLTVEAYDRSGLTKKLATGQLLTTDNQIDASTGTLKLKAIFPNTDNALFPNQFVNVTLLVTTKTNVILAPTVAIQHGNQSTFCYVVDPATHTVKKKDITVGTPSLDGSDAEIKSGLAEGDILVTDGVDKLHDGSKVIVMSPGSSGGHSESPAATPPAGIGSGS